MRLTHKELKRLYALMEAAHLDGYETAITGGSRLSNPHRVEKHDPARDQQIEINAAWRMGFDLAKDMQAAK